MNSTMQTMKKHPNIAISGNPAVGKTKLAKKLVESIESFTYLDFGKDAVDRGFHDGWDDELGCHIVDYDAMASDLKDSLNDGGYVIDWIHADFWPRDGSIDLVVTVICDNAILFDRYQARGYSKAKIDENLDSEIMQEITEENFAYFDVEGYPSSTTLVVMNSDTDEDMARNVKMLIEWVDEWQTKYREKEKEKEKSASKKSHGANSARRRAGVDPSPS